MRVKLSDVYNNECTDFVMRRDARDTVTAPDKQVIEPLGSRTTGYFLKKFTKEGRMPYHILAICSIEGDTSEVYLAFRMPADLGVDLDAMDPKEVLEAFVDEYGLVVKSEHHSGKLI